MLESIDVATRNVEKTTEYNKYVVFYFVIVSFAYMTPWTSIGSLITYFTCSYGPSYFVYLNVAFYCSGLPVALFQRRFDSYYDTIYGSKYMYRLRVYIGLLLDMGLLIAAPFAGYVTFILIVFVIGVSTWSSHGCASTLASIVKYRSNVMQQIGFALPAVYSIIMSQLLDLHDHSIDHKTISLFYFVTAVIMLPGLLSWVY